jgi:hypothetical protein
MSHFARVNAQGIVEQVIVAEQDFIDSLPDASSWVQTSYNTHGGEHYGQDGQPDGGVALRKNYAGIGFKYDADRDAFIPPKPYDSWLLDEDTCLWNAPVAMPEDAGTGEPPKMYRWDEETTNWVVVIVEAE